DKQTFNPFTGVYDLQGNVHVEIGDRIITGDAAQVSMYKLEVHGQGNITLREGDITFDCDTVDVYGKEKTAYVAGNMNFTQGDMIISADTGSFNWSTKNAVFNGNVIVNGEPKNGEVIYNVREKVFVN
ncbi:LptA/OstA family protein, partial [Phascolarctobacterium faecium]